eukprot:864860-Amphidinium_carterae.1
MLAARRSHLLGLHNKVVLLCSDTWPIRTKRQSGDLEVYLKTPTSKFIDYDSPGLHTHTQRGCIPLYHSYIIISGRWALQQRVSDSHGIWCQVGAAIGPNTVGLTCGEARAVGLLYMPSDS